MAQESISDLRVDDFYFSALSNENENENENEIFPVSDVKYAEELQLQEALMSSVNASQTASTNGALLTIEAASSSSISEPLTLMVTVDDEEEEICEHLTKKKEDVGEPSQSFCEICVERKESDEMFRNESCSHSFCTDCISKHVASKIQGSKQQMVTCPGLNCKGVLELDTCGAVISKDVVDQWEEALCESLILPSQKFYCPFKDCSIMMVNDNEEVVITTSECPVCRRLFCAQCYVPWHSGIGCEEFQRLNEDERRREDLMVMELAKEKNWKRCPRCQFYVEKTDGCLHITCTSRCGFQFCYGCGAEWTHDHGGCQGV